MTESYTVETTADETQRQDYLRSDPRVRRYLPSRRPAVESEGLYCYRTDACLACNQAQTDGAPAELLAFLEAEYEWAVSELIQRDPDSMRKLGYDVPAGPAQPAQLDLFETAA